MTNMLPMLYRSALKGLKLLGRGKVRDIYDVDEEHLLIVATDRLSVFDVILPDLVPGKGKVLTEVSNFWFQRFASLIPNHLTDINVADIISEPDELMQVAGRSIVARKLKVLPVEAIARAYLIGSGWNDYQASQSICGIALPVGLRQAERLPDTIFTPATKASIGEHDENIDFKKVVALVGYELAERIRDVTIKIYTEAAAYAQSRGIIIADTKLEFGLTEDGQLVLIDELLTPDSSRFWPMDSWRAGTSPPCFDKQYIRDYLETMNWDKKPPGPRLPEAVIDNTAAKYHEARDRLVRHT